MTINLTSTTVRGTNRRQRRLGVALVGATLSVALVAGIATWRSAGQTEHATPTSVAQPAAPAVSSASAGSASLPRTDQGGVLYVVASQAEAQALRQAIAEADAIRAASSLSPAAAVEVLASDLDVVIIAEALPRTPGLTVTDLRAHAATVTGTAAASQGDALTRELDALMAAGLGVPVAP